MSGVLGEASGTYADVYANTLRPAGAFASATLAFPSGADVVNGNGWLLTNTPLIGSFTSQTWNFQTRFITVTGTGGVGGRASIALYKSPNKSGASGSMITSQIYTNIVQPVSSGGASVSASFNPGKITLNNEYLFLLEAFDISFFPSPQTLEMRLGSITFLSSSDFTIGLPMVVYGGKMRGGKVISL
jgi:hypothetical protein